MKLTETMKQILSNANLETNEINNVPLSTAEGLKDRKLIPEHWSGDDKTTATAGGDFPMYSRVKLTELGIETAVSIKNKTNN